MVGIFSNAKHDTWVFKVTLPTVARILIFTMLNHIQEGCQNNVVFVEKYKIILPPVKYLFVSMLETNKYLSRED